MSNPEPSPPSNGSGQPRPSGSPLIDAASDFQKSGQRLVYFAAERTLLSWIRAGIALIALGFVVERLSVVLLSVAADSGKLQQSRILSFWCGAGCIFLGSLMNAFAAVRYFRFVRCYRRTGSIDPGRGLEAVVVFAMSVSALGLAIVGWLLATR